MTLNVTALKKEPVSVPKMITRG